MKPNKPHSSALRQHRRTTEPGTFFITKSLQPRQPVLATEDLAARIIEPLAFSVAKDRIQLAAFVVMPDHWHALFAVRSPWTLPKLLHSVDTWIGSHTWQALRQTETCWQDGFHDTLIRSTKQFHHVLHYIEENPVTKKLVQRQEAWRWSSANSRDEHLLTSPWPNGFPYDKSGDMIGIYD